MNRKLFQRIALFALLLSPVMAPITAQAANEQTINDSKIEGVTIFLDKAQVNRSASLTLPKGVSTLTFTQLSSKIIHSSVQVGGQGLFTLLSVESDVSFLEDTQFPAHLKPLKDSLKYYEDALKLNRSEQEVLQQEKKMISINLDLGGKQEALTVEQFRNMADFYRQRMKQLVKTQLDLAAAEAKLEKRYWRLSTEIDEVTSLYEGQTGIIRVQVSTERPTKAVIAFNYMVNDASWTPFYDVRAQDTQSPIQLSYKALVSQYTGEQWNNVPLTLSTANPNLGGTKPELDTWWLSLYEPYQMKQRLMASNTMRAQPAAAEADLWDDEGSGEDDWGGSADSSFEEEYDELSFSATTTANFTTVLESSLNTRFVIALPYTIPPGGETVTVDINTSEIATSYRYSSTPKLDKDAFLQAQVTEWEQYNLLPGDMNIYFEGTFVSTAYLDTDNTTDTLNISLGRDKKLVLERKKLVDFTTKKVVGKYKRETYTYEISMRNNKSQAVTLSVEDQLPLSTHEDIEISLVEGNGAQHNNDTGKLTWEVALEPGESKTLKFTFEVKYPKNRTVTGL